MQPIIPIAAEKLPNVPQVQALVSFLQHEAQPMIVLDPDYNILAANIAYQRQFGSVDAPYLGQKCYRISHHYDVPCDQAGEHCPMRQARLSRGPDRVLHIHHTPRGPEHVEVELRPILDAHGEIAAYVERLTLVRSASARPSGAGLVGRSAAFNAALAALQRVAPSMLPVLLLGESGTGKELFARAVHEASDRASGPFVVVDCSGLTETLFESELFGHEKGAFTGATARKQGLVETAQGGTLFLDEIGDVPLAMQVKLLRLIESGTYRRVGGIDTQHANFRLVAATHKPLRQMMAQGLFRPDLYYRISAFPIRLPALRERRDDIPLLVHSFLQRAVPGQKRLTIAPDALEALQRHDWPGNIRELRNVLERARLFADDGMIRVAHLPHWDEPALAVTPMMPTMPVMTAAPLAVGTPAVPALAPPVAAAAQARHDGGAHAGPDAGAHAAGGPGASRAVDDAAEFARAVAAFRGTRAELAAHLGMSERTLYRRLKAQGLA